MRLTIVSALLPACALANDLLNVGIFARDPVHLHKFISRNSELDYGCRPVIMRSEDEHKVHAIVSEQQLEQLHLDATVRVDVLHDLRKRQADLAPIGAGDRFKGGKVAPRGLGSRPVGESATLGPILNYEEVTTALKGLEKEYDIELFTAPEKTFEGQTVTGAAVNKAEKIKKDKQYIYFTSGIHARERGGPDNLIYFISDLLWANKHRKGLTYGNKTFTNTQVKKALGAGIVFIPMLNPDGVRHDQQNSNLWRKNRNPASSIPGRPLSVGVDLNRNFDFLWNYTKHFDPTIEAASNNPSSQAFYGTGPFSEPETRNMAWVYDIYPNLHWYIDVHSAAGTLLYSWGDDVNQAMDPKQNLFNAAYDGKRGIIEDELYREFIHEEDWYNIALQANRTTAAMNAVGARDYIPQPASGLYPTSGASDDWSFSRWHKNKKLTKVYGFTLEFGYPTNFYPTSTEYIQNILDTSAGFMEFILTATEIGLKD